MCTCDAHVPILSVHVKTSLGICTGAILSVYVHTTHCPVLPLCLTCIYMYMYMHVHVHVGIGNSLTEIIQMYDHSNASLSLSLSLSLLSIFSFLSGLEGTQWLHYLCQLLSVACEVVGVVNDNAQPILIHCSDGWDRTTQVVALAELMLDPYYRTIKVTACVHIHV